MSHMNQMLKRIITLLIAVLFLVSVTALTAAADPGGEGGDVISDGNQGEDTPDGGGDPQEGADVDNGDADSDMGEDGNAGGNEGDNAEQPQDNEQPETSDGGDSDNEQDGNDYINNNEDLSNTDSEYSKPENLDDLPAVSSPEVEVATAEPLPDVEVSDATLFSGIVMWLCVAVGISVVAGVMVSKRTHRKGS